jgi:hypothetical protein
MNPNFPFKLYKDINGVNIFWHRLTTIIVLISKYHLFITHFNKVREKTSPPNMRCHKKNHQNASSYTFGLIS